MSSEPIFSATSVLKVPNEVSAASRARPTSPRRRVMTSWQTVQWLYHWALWLFLVGLVAAQFSCVFWDSSTRHEATVLGQPPENGLRKLSADQIDSEPYTDRIIVCAMNGGRQYQPMQLSRALARTNVQQPEDPSTILSKGEGYRVIRRTIDPGFSTSAWARFSSTCDLIAWTLDAILDSCATLGYNVTRDFALVVDGIDDSASVVGIEDALPILIEPITGDDGAMSRYIVPTQDGSPCVVRLLGKYETPKATSALILRGVERSVYERATQRLLHRDNETLRGTWRHGWFEATDGSKWHSEIISTRSHQTGDGYEVPSRVFDTEHNIELPETTLTSWPIECTWGSIASASDTVVEFQSLAVSNGSEFGIYHFESSQIHILRSKYTLETLLVNLSISWVLMRWAACLIALHRSYTSGRSAVWQAASFGNSVACTRGFHLLPLVLLVRLKPILAATWTTGGWFSGDQRAASEAWFVIYPALAQMVFLHYGVLNIVAKILRRRVSDAMFGPTLAFLCLLHLVRGFTFPEALTSFVSSEEIKNLSLPHMMSPSVVLRLNGNVQWLLYVKLVVLLANWLPLVCFYKSNLLIRKRSSALAGCQVERALALRVANLGGFGSSLVFEEGPTKWQESGAGVVVCNGSSPSRPPVVRASELLRMGYLLIGGRYVLSFNDYFLLVLLMPWRRRDFPPNFRVVVFPVKPPCDDNCAATIAPQPELFRLNDPRLQSIDLFDIAATPMY